VCTSYDELINIFIHFQKIEKTNPKKKKEGKKKNERNKKQKNEGEDVNTLYTLR
jgi:hypothetical protein